MKTLKSPFNFTSISIYHPISPLPCANAQQKNTSHSLLNPTTQLEVHTPTLHTTKAAFVKITKIIAIAKSKCQ